MPPARVSPGWGCSGSEVACCLLGMTRCALILMLPRLLLTLLLLLLTLQGRLPIRVELRGLTAEDFRRILTEPECNMIYQQQVCA